MDCEEMRRQSIIEKEPTRGLNSSENALPSKYFEPNPQLSHSAEDENDQLPSMTSEYKQAAKRQQELMAVYNKVIKDREEEIKEKNEIINNQRIENSKLQYEISDVWRKYDERNSVILIQNNTINRQSIQIDTQTRIIDSMIEESQEFKEKLRKLSDDNDFLKNENNSLKNEIARTGVHTVEHLKSIEEYRTNIHQLNQIISCLQNGNETLSSENKSIKECSLMIEKRLEIYKLQAEHLSAENFKLNNLIKNKIESGPELMFHSTAYDLNDFVKVRDEKPVSWTRIFNAFSKTSNEKSKKKRLSSARKF